VPFQLVRAIPQEQSFHVRVRSLDGHLVQIVGTALVGRRLLVESGAKGESGIGIDGVVAFVDQANDALLVDDDVGAKSPLIVFVLDAVGFQDAVGSEHFAVHVAEEREMEAVLFGESGVGSRAVETDAEDFRIGGGDAPRADASLDSAHLLGTAFRKGENVDSEKDVFLAAVVAELDGFPIVREESEIRSEVADLEGRPCKLCLVNLMR
jgi:hypothetical protein